VPFDRDVREVLDMRIDVGDAIDLASTHPDRLAKLQMLFDREARTYTLYPMATDFDQVAAAERPRLLTGDWASYGPGTVRLPKDAVINIKNPFSIVADVGSPTAAPARVAHSGR
jgi:hypothetical protein